MSTNSGKKCCDDRHDHQHIFSTRSKKGQHHISIKFFHVGYSSRTVEQLPRRTQITNHWLMLNSVQWRRSVSADNAQEMVMIATIITNCFPQCTFQYSTTILVIFFRGSYFGRTVVHLARQT